MGSSRLPGKVLLDLGGKPVLWQIARRLRAASLVDEVVIACPGDCANAPIVAMAQSFGIDCYAGSETDLIDRIYRAATPYAPDAVVWITADCPLLDPDIVDQVIGIWRDGAGKYDIVNTGRPDQPRCIPDGLDASVLSYAVLGRLWREIEGAYWREWFPLYIDQHRSEYRIHSLPCAVDLTHLHWTLDNPEDIELMRWIYRELDRDDGVFGLAEMMRLMSP